MEEKFAVRKIREAKQKEIDDKLAREEKKKLKAEAEKKRIEELRAQGLPTNKKEQEAFDKKKEALAKMGIDIYEQLREKNEAKAKGKKVGRVNLKNFSKKKQPVKQSEEKEEEPVEEVEEEKPETPEPVEKSDSTAR